MSSEPPVLLIGLDQLFLSITSALGFYSRAVSNGVGTKVTFSQTPSPPADFDPGGATAWKVFVTMVCYDSPEDPSVRFTGTWESEGENFLEAMENLAATVERDIRSRHEASQLALSALTLPDPAEAVWSVEEPEFDANGVISNPPAVDEEFDEYTLSNPPAVLGSED